MRTECVYTFNINTSLCRQLTMALASSVTTVYLPLAALKSFAYCTPLWRIDCVTPQKRRAQVLLQS